MLWCLYRIITQASVGTKKPIRSDLSLARIVTYRFFWCAGDFVFFSVGGGGWGVGGSGEVYVK